MGLKKLNNIYIDLTRISFIGELDKTIRHDINVNITTFFFELVIDGNRVSIKDQNIESLLKVRNYLIDELTKLDIYLPG